MRDLLRRLLAQPLELGRVLRGQARQLRHVRLALELAQLLLFAELRGACRLHVLHRIAQLARPPLEHSGSLLSRVCKPSRLLRSVTRALLLHHQQHAAHHLAAQHPVALGLKHEAARHLRASAQPRHLAIARADLAILDRQARPPLVVLAGGALWNAELVPQLAQLRLQVCHRPREVAGAKLVAGEGERRERRVVNALARPREQLIELIRLQPTLELLEQPPALPPPDRQQRLERALHRRHVRQGEEWPAVEGQLRLLWQHRRLQRVPALNRLCQPLVTLSGRLLELLLTEAHLLEPTFEGARRLAPVPMTAVGFSRRSIRVCRQRPTLAEPEEEPHALAGPRPQGLRAPPLPQAQPELQLIQLALQGVALASQLVAPPLALLRRLLRMSLLLRRRVRRLQVAE